LLLHGIFDKLGKATYHPTVIDFTHFSGSIYYVAMALISFVMLYVLG
jgi:hypothetical protein